MNDVYTRKGKVLRTIYVDGPPLPRIERMKNELHYWRNVKQSAIPGGRVEAFADRQIERYEKAIAIEEALLDEEKPKNHMGAVG